MKAVIDLLVKKATNNIGAYETLRLVLDYLPKLSMKAVKDQLSQHKIDDSISGLKYSLIESLSNDIETFEDFREHFSVSADRKKLAQISKLRKRKEAAMGYKPKKKAVPLFAKGNM